MKYPSFKENCLRGYYLWQDDNNNYPTWKMRVKQFNGYHWNPFLYEIASTKFNKTLFLDTYGAKLLFIFNGEKISISVLSNGFLFESEMSNGTQNSIIENFINAGTINKNRELPILQNSDGIDLEDRIEKLRLALEGISSNN